MPQAEIALKAGRFINRFKMAKHIRLTIAEGTFSWQRDQESIERETQLDGIYVIRTSESEKRVSAEDGVRSYKLLANLARPRFARPQPKEEGILAIW